MRKAEQEALLPFDQKRTRDVDNTEYERQSVCVRLMTIQKGTSSGEAPDGSDINLDLQLGQYDAEMANYNVDAQAQDRDSVRPNSKKADPHTVDFCDTLADILRKTKTEQHKNRFKYGELYHLNYYKEVKEKDRTYYEVYSLPRTEEVPDGYKEISFVCLRPDGAYESPSTVSVMTRSAKKKLEGFEDFHFHMLRHTFTSNLLSNGAAPKDVQEYSDTLT